MSQPPDDAASAISVSERPLLVALSEVGGGASLDQFSRLVVGTRILPGHVGAWLKLVSKGAVAGEFGRIILTEAGRAAIA